jgi:hypothetical protein
MYLIFLDESGTPPKPDKSAGQYLVIAGVIIPEGAWHGVKQDIDRIRRKYKIIGEIKWKHFGSKAKQDNNPVAHLTKDEKRTLREAFFKIITARKALKIVSCVTCVESAYKMPTVKDQDDIYGLTYKGVTERFQYFLQDSSRITGQQQYGIIISDHRMHQDNERLKARHHDLIDQSSAFTSNYPNIIETIMFSPSHVSPGLQLSDMVAGSIHRAYQYSDGWYAALIKPALRTSSSGEIVGYGLVKMPKGSFIEPKALAVG